MDGFYGRILFVDLEHEKFKIEKVPKEVYRTYLGGKGLASWLLYKYNPPGIDPLDSGNHLIFATGPATGTLVWGSSRYGVFTKSPQTGIYSESYSGGKVPEAINATGFDAVIITGKSNTPVVLKIHPSGAEFHDGRDLWGLDTFKTEDFVNKRFGSGKKSPIKSGCVVIGPAGENLVRFAVIENDYWRSAGRTGPGTVMGSKKLKAIFFEGDKKRPVNNPGSLSSFAKNMVKENRKHPATDAYKSMGTPMMVKIMNQAGAFPTRYWSKGSYDRWPEISWDALNEKCSVKPNACLKCFMACGRMTTLKEGRHKGLVIEGPEYETIYAFGGLCQIDDINEIAYLNHLCDAFGVDTITAGNLCAFTIEAVKRGKISHNIDYGNFDAIILLIEDIVKKRGIGEILAEGIRYAAGKWGLEDVAVHVKGMEPAGYDPRVLKGMGLGYAVSDRGACHLRSTFYKPELAGMIDPDQIEGKAKMFIDFEDRLTLFDTMILCRFYRDFYSWEKLGEMVNILTGLSGNMDSLKNISAGIADLIRKFNIREGMKPEDDCLPSRLHKPLDDSGKVLTKQELEIMVREYYKLRNWLESGLTPGPGRP